VAPFADEIESTVNGERTVNWIQFTYPFNMTKSPAATVQAGTSSGGLPIGIQLIGPQHGDLVVLRTAAALEAALDLDTLAPLPA
jgi:aspartyl-tRNA(Asn)/glutamyl-tRNA(Gln) amidotransferase subunit A